jgi:hypothetical protein
VDVERNLFRAINDIYKRVLSRYFQLIVPRVFLGPPGEIGWINSTHFLRLRPESPFPGFGISLININERVHGSYREQCENSKGEK